MNNKQKDNYDIVLEEFYKTCDTKQVMDVLKSANSEYDGWFLGFLEQYYYLSKLIPTHWTIVDFGCASGFQAEFFKKHAKYIGVEIADCVKYETNNSKYFNGSIDDFINGNEFDSLDLSTTFAICNYVPCAQEVWFARKVFKNLFVYYPAGNKIESSLKSVKNTNKKTSKSV